MTPRSQTSAPRIAAVRTAAVIIVTVLVLALRAFGAPAGDTEQDKDEDLAFVSLFNGRDLSGWVNVNCAPDTFTVRDGMIHSTGVPTGLLRTERQYENFILELEWMHLRPQGNAGLFVWAQPVTAPGTPFAQAIEVQILDGRNSDDYTSHGDVFAIHGADMVPDRPHPNGWKRCLPSERRARPAGEWNHYRVECRDGRVALAVNGKVVSGASQCTPRKGYLVLESEGSPAVFRNIRIRELPGGGAGGDESAAPAEAFRPLYTGVDLSGWKPDPGHDGHWLPSDWVLRYDGESEAAEPSLWTEREFGDFRLICDWRFPREPAEVERPVILPSGEYALDEDGKQRVEVVRDAGDSGIYLRGSSKSQVNMWCWPIGSGEVYGYRTDASQPPDVRRGVTPRMRADHPPGRWNRFAITMRGERLTVDLNGERVIADALLPGVAERGPLALQHHGDPIEFANILIKELGVYQARSFPLAMDDGEESEFRYRLLEPDFVEPGTEYPLVLFLHGAGERGSDNERQLAYLPARLAERATRDAHPAYVLAPQCAEGKRWWEVDWAARESAPFSASPSAMMRGAIRALAEVVARHPIDRRRIYLTGLSMGGYGAWDLAVRHPDWFAAVAPVCGGGDAGQAKRLVGLPLWAFHGDADTAVPVERSRRMVQAVRDAGGEPRYSELPGVGHDSWTFAYGDESGLLSWLFAQRREAPADLATGSAEANR